MKGKDELEGTGAILPLGSAISSTGRKLFGGCFNPPLRRTRVKVFKKHCQLKMAKHHLFSL